MARVRSFKVCKTAGFDGSELHTVADEQDKLFDSDTKNEDDEILVGLKSKLMRHETKKQAFAFNLYKN